jgi:UDP-glucose 4-epimerase
MVDGIVATVGRGQVQYVPWPADYVNVETGDYVTDIGKLSRMTPWRPSTTLSEGLSRTFAYYREHLPRYL